MRSSADSGGHLDDGHCAAEQAIGAARHQRSAAKALGRGRPPSRNALGGHSPACVHTSARSPVLLATIVRAGCSSPDPPFPAGKRLVVSVAGLEAFKNSED